MAYTIGGKQNLPEVGDIITEVKLGEDRMADIYFKSGKRIPVHLGPERLDKEPLNSGDCHCGSSKYTYHHKPYDHAGWKPDD